jgi:cytochrome c-type biogenesis protein CcmH/NrfG
VGQAVRQLAHPPRQPNASFKQALDLDPNLAQAHRALGGALLAQGRFAEAYAASQRALDLLPPKTPAARWRRSR